MLLGSAHMPCLKQMQRGGVEWSFQGLKEGEGEHAARLLPPLWDPHIEFNVDPLLTELLSCT